MMLVKIAADVLPALGRAKDNVYVSKSGDTLKKLAKKFYDDESYAPLIQRVPQNDPAIDKDGNIRPGFTLVVPYVPLQVRIDSDKKKGASKGGSDSGGVVTGDLGRLLGDLFG